MENHNPPSRSSSRPPSDLIKAGDDIEHIEICDVGVDGPISARVRRKFDRHIIPWLWGLFMFSFLDRSNIGNAKIAGLSEDLNLKGTEYNLALLMFFIPYILVDLPSNWVLKYARAGWYLAGLVTCWGIVSTFMGFVKNLGGLITCRVLMGFFEGGLIPGILIYLPMFYRKREMAWRTGAFYSANPFSSAFAGLLATGLTQIRVNGYDRWPWIFFVEGGATAIFGACALFFLPHDIRQAKFLTEEERDMAYTRIRIDNQGAHSSDIEDEKFSWHWVRLALKGPITWLICIPYLFLAICVYSYALFLPSIILSMGYSSTHAQLLTAPPNLCGFISVLVCARLSDKIGLRSPFIIAGTALVIVGYIMLLASDVAGVKYTGTFLVAIGMYPSMPLYLSWLSNNSAPHYTRATATALSQMIGNCAAFVSSYTYQAQDAPHYTLGHSINIGSSCLACLGTVLALWYCHWENGKRARGERDCWVRRSGAERLGNLHPDFRYML